MLFQLGVVTFEIVPFNVHEVSRTHAADYAAKDVLGRAKVYEFVGEGEEHITMAGRLFPSKFGGLGDLSTLDAMRSSGVAQILVRGDFTNLGWFIINSVSEKSTFLDNKGVGKMIEFDISLTRAQSPGALAYLSTFLRLFG